MRCRNDRRDVTDDASTGRRVVAQLQHGHRVRTDGDCEAIKRRRPGRCCINGLTHLAPRILDAEAEHLTHEFLSRGEVVIQAAGLDPGLSGNIAQSRTVALLGEHRRRSVEDAGPRSLGLRPRLREVRLLTRI